MTDSESIHVTLPKDLLDELDDYVEVSRRIRSRSQAIRFSLLEFLPHDRTCPECSWSSRSLDADYCPDCGEETNKMDRY